MNDVGTWNLLKVATASLTISVSLLLWFLTDFINLLRRAEVQATLREQEALAKSVRVVVIVAGLALVVAAGCLCGVVAWENIATLKIALWSCQFYLLFLCVLLPVVGGLAAGILMLENIGHKNIKGAFMNLVKRIQRKPLILSGVIETELVEKPTNKSFPVSAPVLQDWDNVLRWVKQHEGQWRLGKGFLSENRKILVSVVDDQWRTMQSRGDTSADKVPEAISEQLAQALERLNANYAVVLNRPSSIAKAACALYAHEIYYRGEEPHV